MEFQLGCKVIDAMEKLFEYKAKGELACGEFNTVMLYSDKDTVDSAYLKVTGKNKEFFDNLQKEMRENLNIPPAF